MSELEEWVLPGASGLVPCRSCAARCVSSGNRRVASILGVTDDGRRSFKSYQLGEGRPTAVSSRVPLRRIVQRSTCCSMGRASCRVDRGRGPLRDQLIIAARGNQMAPYEPSPRSDVMGTSPHPASTGSSRSPRDPRRSCPAPVARTAAPTDHCSRSVGTTSRWSRTRPDRQRRLRLGPPQDDVRAGRRQIPAAAARRAPSTAARRCSQRPHARESALSNWLVSIRSSAEQTCPKPARIVLVEAEPTPPAGMHADHP